MTRAEALAYVGGLSSPSKMPGHGYSLPAAACRTGSWLRAVPGSVCSRCYACRGQYTLVCVQAAMARRLESLSKPGWAEAMALAIPETETHFRWHDSGDLQSVTHLCQLVRVARLRPDVRFWLPTREIYDVLEYMRAGTLPPNLCVRVSAVLVDYDGPLPSVTTGVPCSIVRSKAGPVRGFACPAQLPGPDGRKPGKCGACRACWDKSVRCISYLAH